MDSIPINCLCAVGIDSNTKETIEHYRARIQNQSVNECDKIKDNTNMIEYENNKTGLIMTLVCKK